jgi:hypothetical protein
MNANKNEEWMSDNDDAHVIKEQKETNEGSKPLMNANKNVEWMSGIDHQ